MAGCEDESKYFKKRAGTTDLGKDYEDAFVASHVLNLAINNNIDAFKFASNDAEFGLFDDVIMDIKTIDNINSKYALQLKHISNYSRITRSHFMALNGNYSIPKYFENYKSIKEKAASYKFIIFTNKKLDSEGDTMTIGDVGVQFRETYLSNHVSNHGKCYRLEVVNDSTPKDREYMDFFEKLYIYTNQNNVSKFKLDIIQTFKESFNCKTDDAAKCYLRFISEWSNLEGKKKKLTKNFICKVIALQLLNPHIRPLEFLGNIENNPLMNILSPFGTVSVPEQFADEILQLPWHNSTIDFVGAKVRRISKYYQINLKHEDAESKIYWLCNASPLVVDDSESTYHAINLCQNKKKKQKKNKKFIFLSKNFHRAKISAPINVFENLTDLSRDSEEYRLATETLEIVFQGKEHCKLSNIINSSSKVEALFGVGEFVKMLNSSLRLGDGKLELPSTRVGRFLSTNVLNRACIDNIPQDTVLVISCCQYNPTIREQENIVLFEKECSFTEFRQICQKRLVTHYHHLKTASDGSLQWVDSLNGTDYLNQYREVSETIRTPENWLFHYEKNSRIEIIHAEPGMGKTTLIKNIKNNYSEVAWKITIYVKDHAPYFRANSRRDHPAFHFLNYIIEKLKIPDGSLDKQLLTVLRSENRLVLFWDGLDEISEEEFEVAIAIIKAIAALEFKQFVTGRSHLMPILESRLGVFSRTLVPFDDSEQRSFIRSLLTCPENSKDAAVQKVLLYLEFNSYSNNLGIPLQIGKVVEMFNKKSSGQVSSYDNFIQYFGGR